MLRRARISDLDALVALENHFPSDRINRRNFRYLLTRAHANVWLYEDSGCMLGDLVILYRHNISHARIYSIVVDPRFSGRGIGTALMQTAEEDAYFNACTAINLEVRPDNVSALSLYKKCGYLITESVADFYQDRTPALKLRKALRSIAPSLPLSTTVYPVRPSA